MNSITYRIGVACLLFAIFGCKNTNAEKKENVRTTINEISNLDFDKILKINEYVYGVSDHGDFFTTSYDAGVYYDPKNGNDLGNLVTFLVPKDFLFFQKHLKYIKDGEPEPLEEYINKLSIEEYKKRFDIYVFLVDKKYLISTPGYDSPYNYTEKYQTDVYQYKNKVWEKIESFIVDSDKKRVKEPQWRYNFIEKKTKEVQTAFFDSISKLKIDDSWYRDYIVSLDSYEPNYNYNYLISFSKDSAYIVERPLKDLMLAYQSKDTFVFISSKISPFRIKLP